MTGGKKIGNKLQRALNICGQWEASKSLWNDMDGEGAGGEEERNACHKPQIVEQFSLFKVCCLKL